MELIIALLLGGGCFALGRWALKRRAAARQAAPPLVDAPAVDRGLDELQPGDVLTHEGADYLVTGVARLTEADVGWIECRLEDAGQEAWVIVHAGDPDGVVVGHRVADLVVAGDRPSESLDHRGEVFRLESHGRASAEVSGELERGLAPGECRYWNYRRPGDGRVWLRRVEERWVAFAGARTRRHLVGFLPGS